MKPQRFQPLQTIYKSLSNLLHDITLLLHTTDFTKPEAAETKKRTEEILLLFEYQTALEESLLFPSIHDYEPFVTAILRDDHRERRKQIRILQDLIAVPTATSEEYLNILFAGRLIRRFNEFTALCIGQMRNHESIVTPILWRYYSDSELKLLASSLQERSVMYHNHATVAA